ncbi:hypothetical protein PR048_011446 [Dryococelus australis]|uniref:Uncharacterized protein n=1 Tax=Dryococelus australis TaxID=614101 RepID=A0ABQ9HM69_9NEOP|nr:hypothetical protein PR048_011446 [Dryococelus australis]
MGARNGMCSGEERRCYVVQIDNVKWRRVGLYERREQCEIRCPVTAVSDGAFQRGCVQVLECALLSIHVVLEVQDMCWRGSGNMLLRNRVCAGNVHNTYRECAEHMLASYFRFAKQVLDIVLGIGCRDAGHVLLVCSSCAIHVQDMFKTCAYIVQNMCRQSARHVPAICWVRTGSVLFRGRWKREIPEKAPRPTASSGTIPTCESPLTRPGIEPGSPWREASVLIAQPPWPHYALVNPEVPYRAQDNIFSWVAWMRKKKMLNTKRQKQLVYYFSEKQNNVEIRITASKISKLMFCYAGLSHASCAPEERVSTFTPFPAHLARQFLVCSATFFPGHRHFLRLIYGGMRSRHICQPFFCPLIVLAAAVINGLLSYTT